MLANGKSVKQLIEEIDHYTFSDTRIDSVNMLLTLRTKQPDNRTLQKLIDHYVIELKDIDMVVLKP